MNILILNSTLKNLKISLQKDEIFDASHISADKNHNEIVLIEIDKLLKKNNLKIDDIDIFGCFVGPGSFTGIRVGIATIKGFCDALNKKNVSLNTLEYLSLCAKTNSDISVCAIKGSMNSYFVSQIYDNEIKLLPYNITKDELLKLSKNKKIGVYSTDYDENINSYIVAEDKKVLFEYLLSKINMNIPLLPIYYQLSQAELNAVKDKTQIKFLDKNNSNDEKNKTILNSIFELENNIFGVDGYSLKTLIEILNTNNHKIIIAILNDELIGYAIIDNIKYNCTIEKIVVDPIYQHKNVGQKLLDFVVDFAITNEKDSIYLEVSTKNMPAIAMYKKNKFESGRVRENYYKNGGDALEMSKLIKLDDENS